MQVNFETYQYMITLIKQHFNKKYNQIITIKDLKRIASFDTSGQLAKIFEYASEQAGLMPITDSMIDNKRKQLIQTLNSQPASNIYNEGAIENLLDELANLQKIPFENRGLYPQAAFYLGATDLAGHPIGRIPKPLQPLTFDDLIEALTTEINFIF